MPDNDIGWGQGAVNNDIGWGKAKTNNDIGWGAIYDNSPSGDTDLIGASASTFTNTKSIQFDGVNDLATASSNLGLTGAFSLSLWINTTQSTSDGYKVLAGEYNWGNSSLTNWLLYLSNTRNRIAFLLKNSSGTSIVNTVIDDSVADIDDGKWHHIFVVYGNTTDTNSFKIYVDGSIAKQLTPSGTGLRTTSQPFEIAGTQSSTPDLFGLVDEVAIWDSDQSANAVEIYNSGTPNDLSTYSPLHWWRMGDGDTFPTLTDNGSGSIDLTMTNMASSDIVEFVPDATVGVANTKSLDFDGVNDYVNAGNKDEYSFGDGTNDSPFSMSFWFYADTLSSTNRVSISKFGSSSKREYAIRVDSGFVTMDLCDASNNLNRIIINHTVDVTFNTGRWYHIAFTYDGSGTTAGADIYVDGVVASTATKTKSLGYTAMGNKNVNLEIGARTGGGKYTDGHIDEFALFDYELSADAISEIYNIRGSGRAADMNNLTNATTDPILWYRMGDGDTYPTITNHGSLASADGTMTNMASDDITDFTF